MTSYPPYQQLDEFAKATQPTTLSTLKQWMQDRISQYNRSYSSATLDPSELKGKIYTASSLKWRNSNRIEQTGNAPNYYDGVWSLATCKHHMRSQKTFRNWFSKEGEGTFQPTKPLFVYTVAEKADHCHTNGRNAVASIALVTHGFKTVEAYAQFLKEDCPESAFTSRRTRTGNSEAVGDIESHAREVGDCHANPDCEGGAPNPAHQHVSQTGENCRCGEPRRSVDCTCARDCSTTEDDRPIYERDLDTDHIKCLSMPGYWTTWETPSFVAQPPDSDRVGRAPNGHNIHSFSAVGEYLHEYDTER